VTRLLHRLSAGDLSAGYRSGELRVTEVLEQALERVEVLDPKLRAFIEVDEAGARRGARDSTDRIGAGTERPLEGVPVAIKANIAVEGLGHSAGIEARRGIAAAADATAVARLRGAGAIIIGTLNMDEAALGAASDNPWFGRVLNPHGDGRTPGGSSGGSGAAVAAGLCVAALGTDTLGSVRIPAAYCGVYGLKPTPRTVSQDGLELVAADFDTIGPLARSLGDIEALTQVIADPGEPRAIENLMLVRNLGGVHCQPAVLASFERALNALRQLGYDSNAVIDLDLSAIRLAGFIHASRELGDRLQPMRERDPSGFSQSLHFLLDYGARRPEAQVREAASLLKKTRAALSRNFAGGVLLLPTAPQSGFVHGSRAPANQADFTGLASIAGLPALSIPAGLDEDGMPVAVQLVAEAGNELGLIDLARRLEPFLGGFIPPPVY
jgi:aspartyl-tRNA(Asn)/glutamyl-tRNA(Gln) amidotransferase subunit A